METPLSDIQFRNRLLVACTLAFVLTPLPLLLCVADWKAPGFGAEFIAPFHHTPWLKMSALLTALTLLFPFFYMHPPWAREDSHIGCAVGFALYVAGPIFATMADPRASDHPNRFLWAAVATLMIHGAAANVISRSIWRHARLWEYKRH